MTQGMGRDDGTGSPENGPDGGAGPHGGEDAHGDAGVPGGNGPYGGGPRGPHGPPPYGNGPYGNGPYGNGPYGWGGRGGRTPPPPPPRPGVIPLAPLGLGDLLGGAFATMGRHWRPLLGVAALAYGCAALVAAAALAVAYRAVGDDLRGLSDPGYPTAPAWHDVRPLLLAFLWVWVIGMLALLLANALVQAACPELVRHAVLGRRTTLRATLRRASARLPAVLGTAALSWLIALVPMALFLAASIATVVPLVRRDGSHLALWLIVAGFAGALALTPPAVWLWVRFALAPAAAVIESQGPVAALRRSAELVRGAWWRIFGISLLAYVMAAFAGMVLQQLIDLAGLFPAVPGAGDDDGPTAGAVLVTLVASLALSLAGQFLSQIVLTAFPQLVLNLLYVDQRIRAENLAPTLAAAAEAADRPGG
ncbi:hypothetical protein ACFYYH_17710 [Streptomyces sp. NPDC002018]|uniref:DUF7847 domain-containing protein n=1 Tax=Streptomyces sp. NPDC002018 TaxID=3364629 RepID=UPI0036D10655